MIDSTVNRVFTFCFACLLLGQSALAGNLSLAANDLVWDPAVDGPISPVLTVGVENDTSPDAERLLGWQLRLQLVPAVGAEGTLLFESGTEPAANYLLEGVSAGFSAAPGTSLFAFDDDGTLAGVAVPLSGATLIDLAFKTNNNARGSFQLMAVPGLANTQWSDGEFADRAFVELPLDGSELIPLATITVVPEPASLALVGLGCALLAGWMALRRPRSSSPIAWTARGGSQ